MMRYRGVVEGLERSGREVRQRDRRTPEVGLEEWGVVAK